MSQRAIPAVWMRGGTSKGLFFHSKHLPVAGAARDTLLARALGSPDPYRNQIDGLGGATSSTSKVVIIAPSERDDCDIDYLFGHVAIDTGHVDYSGNCGNLSAAVGAFALDEGLVEACTPVTQVRIWQANLNRRFVATVPVSGHHSATQGNFQMDGVAFTGAPIDLAFEDAGGGDNGAVLPTGNVKDTLDIPGLGAVDTTLINAGNPAVFVRAADLGLTGTETPTDMHKKPQTLVQLQRIRTHATVAMGLAENPKEAEQKRPATPKIHWLGPPKDHQLPNGRRIRADEVDLCARALSMGRAHHAYPGTSAIATAVAAALPGSLAYDLNNAEAGLTIGHAAGTLNIAAELKQLNGIWTAPMVRLQRSARRLMRGEVFIP